MIRRIIRWLRWYFAKSDLTSGSDPPPEDLSISYEENRAKFEDFVPNARGYKRLAGLWEEYAGWSVPDYGAFLASARDYYQCPILSVLDLACGTGLLSRQLAGWAEKVVGLDINEDMLREAKRRTTDSNIRYMQGDFHDFFVDGTFDAAICGSDSLNYVHSPGELANVFRCIGRHLRPGGLFAFDVLDHWCFMQIAGMKRVVKVGDDTFEMLTFYDPVTRVVENLVVFEDTVERHRRVSITKGDVTQAACAAKLECLEHFPGESRELPTRQFYLLRVPRS